MAGRAHEEGLESAVGKFGTQVRAGSVTVVSVSLFLGKEALALWIHTCQTKGRFFRFASASMMAAILQTPPGAL